MEHSTTNANANNNANANFEDIIQNLKSKNNTLKTYIETLSPLEYKALAISIRELETSFSLEKSIGYINYTKSLNQSHTS
jgi:hypothetical protein